MSIALSAQISKFLKEIATTTGEKEAIRALIDAASAASVTLKQDADADLTDYANAADAQARRALIGAAPSVSPVFSGSPTSSVTPAVNSNDAQLATTLYVDRVVPALSGVVDPNPLATIGSGANGTVNILSSVFNDAPAASFEVVVRTVIGDNAPLSPVLQMGGQPAPTLYINLGNDANGVPDPAKNTATLIAAAIPSAVDGVGAFSAVATGDGSGVVGAQASTPFVGPTPSHIGQDYYDSAASKWYKWNSTTWDELTITAP